MVINYYLQKIISTLSILYYHQLLFSEKENYQKNLITTKKDNIS